ncbi:hypothetical protein M407DRAFT_123031 [Tulasnella calospora MUT 4182]|uniref:Uncharacterized protein n=1 Tax=Tulasnella calospora MUT 4182 TaxID=1051891 RepID=A0A0C3KKH0_9AGAM|nr:hypothetical protein M407DRAFT_123031 [Tulasnella calospora MUT 4182]
MLRSLIDRGGCRSWAGSSITLRLYEAKETFLRMLLSSSSAGFHVLGAIAFFLVP